MSLLVGKIKIGNQINFVTPSENEDEMYVLSGNFNKGFTVTNELIKNKMVEYLIPFSPSKIFGIGRNYNTEDGPGLSEIDFFLMAENALLPHKKELILSKNIGSLIPEGELGVIISKKIKNVTPLEAKNAILGYTICNDFSARDINPSRPNVAIKKSTDGLLPTGPYVLLENNLLNFEIKTYLNDVLIQEGNSLNMINKIPEIISFISQFITLKPFDLIATGTPGPKIKVSRGNILKVSIEGIGTLETALV